MTRTDPIRASYRKSDEAKNELDGWGLPLFHKGKEKEYGPILLICIICIVALLLMLFLYLWPVRNIRHYEPLLLNSDVVDGYNINESTGCFFILKAQGNTNIDPERLSFHVAEKGYPIIKLDFDQRTYDSYGNPSGGDRNRTYNWTVDGELWSEGEYIGFDMPTKDMNIEIVDGNTYEVIIKNPKGELVFKGLFVYTRQGNVDYM